MLCCSLLPAFWCEGGGSSAEELSVPSLTVQPADLDGIPTFLKSTSGSTVPRPFFQAFGIFWCSLPFPSLLCSFVLLEALAVWVEGQARECSDELLSTLQTLSASAGEQLPHSDISFMISRELRSRLVPLLASSSSRIKCNRGCGLSQLGCDLLSFMTAKPIYRVEKREILLPVWLFHWHSVFTWLSLLAFSIITCPLRNLFSVCLQGVPSLSVFGEGVVW